MSKLYGLLFLVINAASSLVTIAVCRTGLLAMWCPRTTVVTPVGTVRTIFTLKQIKILEAFFFVLHKIELCYSNCSSDAVVKTKTISVLRLAETRAAYAAL